MNMMIMSHYVISVVINIRLYDRQDDLKMGARKKIVLHYQPIHVHSQHCTQDRNVGYHEKYMNGGNTGIFKKNSVSSSVVHRNPMMTSTPLAVRLLMTKQSNPGPTNSITGGAYVCNGSSSGSGGSHGCISPGSLLLSYACPLLLERMNPISTQFLPVGAVSSNILQVLGSDLTLLQGVLHLILISLLRPPR